MNDLTRAAACYLRPILREQTRPTKNFVFDMISGMLMAQHVHIAAIARVLCEDVLADDTSESRHVAKRLARRASCDWDHEKLRRLHLERVAKRIGRENGKGVVIAVDYTDLAKKGAKPNGALQLACTCFDGSRREKGVGYPVVQILADHPLGVSYPLDLFPYSNLLDKRSQGAIFLDCLRGVTRYVGRRAIWVFDRGFDGESYLEGFDALHLRWVVRVKCERGSRFLFSGGDVGQTVEALVREVPDRLTTQVHKVSRAGRPYVVHVTVGTLVVRLSNQKNNPAAVGPERTLVVVRGMTRKPMVLLCHERLGDEADVLRIIDAYRRRWSAEVSTRIVKQRDGWGLSLEQIAVYSGRSVERVLLLVMVLLSFLADLQRRRPLLAQKAVSVAQAAGRRKPVFPAQRLLRGAGTLLQRASPAVRQRWRDHVGAGRQRGARGRSREQG